MNEASRIVKIRKNLRALFVLGFVLTLLASIGGGIILILGWYRAPNAAMPIWRFGQWMMLFGLANLFVYTCLFFLIRSLILRVKSPEA
jgi:hypothetical protein